MFVGLGLQPKRPQVELHEPLSVYKADLHFRHDRYFTRFYLMEDHHIQNFVEQPSQQHHYAS